MLKASSLLYAIFICLIIALLCGSIILISSLNQSIETKFSLEEELIATCNASFNYYLNDFEKEYGNELKDYLENGIVSELSQKKWGVFDIVKCKSYVKMDTVYKVGLIGHKKHRNKLALYLTDHDKRLHLSGLASIKGDIMISKFGIDFKRIGNTHSLKSKYFYGVQRKSQKKMPALVKSSFKEELDLGYNHNFYEYQPDMVKHNSFFNETIVIQVSSESRITNSSFSGNIILKSNDSLIISNSVKLKDVIIVAPSVIFEPGFEGSVQVFAKEFVSLQKHTTLLYPSTIYIENDFDILVNIEEYSTLIGGIIVTGKSINGVKNRILNINENGRVIGDVYCYGKTQLKGEIIGTLFTENFYLETSSSKYDNYILNGKINAYDLPKNFIGIPLFKNSESVKYELVKVL